MLNRMISLSGLDGSGKTTQAELLKLKFETLSFKVKILHLKDFQINANSIKEKCKRYLYINKISDKNIARNVTSALIFVEKFNLFVRPEIENNDIIILNRYIDSAECYHFLKNGYSDEVRKVYDTLPSPNINFFIDLCPEQCFYRISKRNSLNEFETIKNLRKAYIFYNNRKNFFEWIDGNKDKEAVFSSILSKVFEKGVLYEDFDKGI